MYESSIKDTIKQNWNDSSKNYDYSPGHVIANIKEETAWKFLLQEKIGGDGKKILDIGTGTGFLSIMLAELGYEVVGLDISEEMMERAKKKAIAEWRRVLKPGGKLCFFLHESQHYVST